MYVCMNEPTWESWIPGKISVWFQTGLASPFIGEVLYVCMYVCMYVMYVCMLCMYVMFQIPPLFNFRVYELDLHERIQWREQLIRTSEILRWLCMYVSKNHGIGIHTYKGNTFYHFNMQLVGRSKILGLLIVLFQRIKRFWTRTTEASLDIYLHNNK